MSENVSDAVNQQGSPPIILYRSDPSETTCRAPFPKEVIKAYLLGCIHDGTLNSKKRFRISQKGTDWLNILKNLSNQLGYNSWIYKEGRDRDVYVLETLASFLDFQFNPLDIKTKKEKRAYIRGFFDAEGGIPRSSNARFYIQLVQSDKDKMDKIKVMLFQLGIKTGRVHNPSRRINPDYWRLYVLSRSRLKFLTDIGSWHPRKVKTLRERVVI